MDDDNELVIRLSTVAGIIMEDACPLAITVPSPEKRALVLAELEQATRDATLLIQAAQVISRRELR